MVKVVISLLVVLVVLVCVLLVWSARLERTIKANSDKLREISKQ